MYRKFLLIICMLPALAHAQGYKYADLLLNSSNGVYAVGDTVRVYADVSAGAADRLLFKVTRDECVTLFEKTVSLREGRNVVFEEVIRKPSHLMFSLCPYGNKKECTMVGAIISPEQMQPGYKAPKDLRKFWDRQVMLMRRYAPEVSLKHVSSADDCDCWSVRISMHEGNPVYGYIAIPKSASVGSLPIIMYAHQAGVKYDFNRASISCAMENARRGRGAIAFDMNVHGIPNDMPQEYYDSLDTGPLRMYHSRDVTGHEDFYYRLAYLRLVRALDYLVTREEWDGEKVLIHGASQGAAQAGALAGIDGRVTAAVLQVPALTDIGGNLDNGRKGGWPSKYASKAVEYKSVLPYYDVALLLELSSAKLFFEAGLVDESCPPSCVAAACNNASSKDKIIVFHPYRPHSSRGTDFRHYDHWRNTVMTLREDFIDEYLK